MSAIKRYMRFTAEYYSRTSLVTGWGTELFISFDWHRLQLVDFGLLSDFCSSSLLTPSSPGFASNLITTLLLLVPLHVNSVVDWRSWCCAQSKLWTAACAIMCLARTHYSACVRAPTCLSFARAEFKDRPTVACICQS